jgi:hypothetical protein
LHSAPLTPAGAATRSRRRAELLALFGLGPALLALGPRWAVSVAILAGGLLSAVALRRDPAAPRDALWGSAPRREIARVLARTAAAWIAILTATAVAAPHALFSFPRHRLGPWLLIMLLYPISAWAQELLYRTFFFHRYGALFERPRTRILASAVLFGWAHVAVNNLLAVGLATAVGLLFAATYERTRSTWLVSLEHALYGDFVFTVGIGPLFYSTARWF